MITISKHMLITSNNTMRFSQSNIGISTANKGTKHLSQ